MRIKAKGDFGFHEKINIISDCHLASPESECHPNHVTRTMSSKSRRSSSHRQQQQQLPGVTPNPTIWQIYFDDDEGPVRVKVDPAAMVEDEVEEVMTNADIDDGRSDAQTHQPTPMKDTEIHIHKTGEPNVSLYSTPASSKKSSSLDIGFEAFEKISGSGKRTLIRRDSDLELLLPPGSSRVESRKGSSVASRCAPSDQSTWKTLLLTTALAVCIAVAYFVAMVAILKGIGGY